MKNFPAVGGIEIAHLRNLLDSFYASICPHLRISSKEYLRFLGRTDSDNFSSVDCANAEQRIKIFLLNID